MRDSSRYRDNAAACLLAAQEDRLPDYRGDSRRIIASQWNGAMGQAWTLVARPDESGATRL